MQLILASQSPRRKELLGLLRLPFTVQVADIDETMDLNKSPCDEVARISRLKAEAVHRDPADVVVAADTIVVLGREILCKPKDEADAYRMLRMLSGCNHQVMTGLCVLRGDQISVCTEVTDIHFRDLTDREIWAYIHTGEPMDKAGAYGIQGYASLFVDKISGDYCHVVGLPVCRLGQILRQIAPEYMEENL